MRVAIIEPDHTGHRLHFARLLADGLLSLGAEVTLVSSPDSMRSAEFSLHLSPLAGRIGVRELGPQGKRGNLGVAVWKAMACRLAWSSGIRADHVFIPSADGLAQIEGALASVGLGLRKQRAANTEALMMRSGRSRRAIGQEKPNVLLRRLVFEAPWRAIHHLNGYFVTAAKKEFGPRADRLRVLPDPVRMPKTSRLEARAMFGLPESARCIGCVGGMNERKGIDRLVKTFTEMDRPDDWFLLLAGKMDERVREVVASLERRQRKSVIAIDRYVDDLELDAALKAMDVVCTPYVRHQGPASIVSRAAAAGKPVLATDFGWMGRIVDDFGLGRTFSLGEPGSLSRGIRELMNGAHEYKQGPKAQRFVAYSSEDNFLAHALADVRTRLGYPPARMTTWDELFEAAEAHSEHDE